MQVKVYFIYIKHALVGRKQSAKRSARIQLFYKCNNKVAGACNFIKKRDSGAGVLLWILWNF